MPVKNWAWIFALVIPSWNHTVYHIGAFQGIEGHIYRISGNQMPSPDRPAAALPGTSTTLYIYALTNLSQARRKGQSAFYFSIGTRLVKKTRSDSSGYFKVALPAGNYSLFTKKGELFYANWMDGAENIAPVQVLPHQTTQVTVRVDYDAYY